MNHLSDLKWKSLLNSSFVCQILERQKEGYQDTSITLIFTPPVDQFLIPYFWLISANFQNEANCLIVNSLTDRDSKWSFFKSCLISGFYSRMQVKFVGSMQWSLFMPHTFLDSLGILAFTWSVFGLTKDQSQSPHFVKFSTLGADRMLMLMERSYRERSLNFKLFQKPLHLMLSKVLTITNSQ